MIVWLLWQNDLLIDVFGEESYAKADAAFASHMTRVMPHDGWKLRAEKDGSRHASCGRVARLELERRLVS